LLKEVRVILFLCGKRERERKVLVEKNRKGCTVCSLGKTLCSLPPSLSFGPALEDIGRLLLSASSLYFICGKKKQSNNIFRSLSPAAPRQRPLR
jgi:hypothetical protein